MLVRTFVVADYILTRPRIELDLDASPWGFGATLTIAGEIVEYIAEAIADPEAQLLQQEIGSCKSQQTFECLAALVALRQWVHRWHGARVELRVRSDSVCCLTMVLAHKASGVGTGIIARELALDVAKACYVPTVVEHVPGIANKT